MIVLYTYDNLEVGKMYVRNRVTDANAEPHDNVGVKIIKEVTVKEYLKCCQELSNCEINYDHLKGARFYEVQMD